MPMPSIESFYAEFNRHGLLDLARFRFSSGRMTEVSGTYRSKPFDGLGGMVEDAVPSFRAPASQLVGVAQGTEVLIKSGSALGVEYVVRSVGKPDDRGEVHLMLRLLTEDE